jgi:hypothetical protein
MATAGSRSRASSRCQSSQITEHRLEGSAIAARRLVRALLLEQNVEWAVQRSRYLTVETIAQMSDDQIISLPVAAR